MKIKAKIILVVLVFSVIGSGIFFALNKFNFLQLETKNNDNKIIELLNKAFADEWLAYYQYWIGEKVIKGELTKNTKFELLEHAQDELRHADMVARRIVELGGVPILKPENWYEKTICGYEAPENFDSKNIIEQNIKAEQCAIRVYTDLVNLTKEQDEETYKIVQEILDDEIEHEKDLKEILEQL